MTRSRFTIEDLPVAIVAFAVYFFLLLPTLVVVPISFGGSGGDIQFPPRHFNLDLYRDLLSSGSWMDSISRSIRVAASTTLATLLIAVPVSYGIVRTEFVGKRLVVALIMSPLAIPSVVIALGVYLYFSYLGLGKSLSSLILVHTFYILPFTIITMSAGIQKLDPRLEFAATLMGASRRLVLTRVVLPQLRASLVAAGLISFLMSFDEVIIAWFLSGPATATLPVKMFTAIQWEISPIIAAIASIMSAISLVACIAASYLQPSGKADANR